MGLQDFFIKVRDLPERVFQVIEDKINYILDIFDAYNIDPEDLDLGSPTIPVNEIYTKELFVYNPWGSVGLNGYTRFYYPSVGLNGIKTYIDKGVAGAYAYTLDFGGTFNYYWTPSTFQPSTTNTTQLGDNLLRWSTVFGMIGDFTTQVNTPTIASGATSLAFNVNSGVRWYIYNNDPEYNLLPLINNSYDVGGSGSRVRSFYGYTGDFETRINTPQIYLYNNNSIPGNGYSSRIHSIVTGEVWNFAYASANYLDIKFNATGGYTLNSSEFKPRVASSINLGSVSLPFLNGYIDNLYVENLYNENPYIRVNVNSGSYTLTKYDRVIGVTYTITGAVTLTLPVISTTGHCLYIIKDEGQGASGNFITINTSGSDTIEDGTETQIIIKKDGASITLYNDNSSKWFISGGA